VSSEGMVCPDVSGAMPFLFQVTVALRRVSLAKTAHHVVITVSRITSMAEEKESEWDAT